MGKKAKSATGLQKALGRKLDKSTLPPPPPPPDKEVRDQVLEKYRFYSSD
jgi:hypothetical protein